MKALIISFFCVILGYSFIVDDKSSKEVSPEQKTSISSDDIDAKKMQHYISDSIEYFAKRKDLIYTNDFSERFF